ncbi:hypothetical protein NDU88_007610 [Pleurodeles waltl]|uniref:Uncharacterized protein n=1 Tax=Pleurodeles waltl TaxID=8319 RepID=A0AAV7VUX9_PLEWA|nr:hypothetical protein NDU88_007610 [Pleurodeles waltl]
MAMVNLMVAVRPKKHITSLHGEVDGAVREARALQREQLPVRARWASTAALPLHPQRRRAPASPSRGDFDFNSSQQQRGSRERPCLQHSFRFPGFPCFSSAAQAGPKPAEPRTLLLLLLQLYAEELQLLSANKVFGFSAAHELGSLLTPLAIQRQNLHNQQYCKQQRTGGSPPPRDPQATSASFFQPLLRRLSESPVFDSPPSPLDCLSDRESYLSGSLSGSSSLSSSASLGLDSVHRLSFCDAPGGA